jgi:hypothetical protein
MEEQRDDEIKQGRFLIAFSVLLPGMTLMSMPDALPMEIALITLLLFKFQAYLTSFCHYCNRPITLSTFRLSHQSTIHHMALINALQLPQEVLLSTRLAPYTHSTASHSFSYLEFNCSDFPRLLSVSLSLFSLQSHDSRIIRPTYGNIVAIMNFQV